MMLRCGNLVLILMVLVTLVGKFNNQKFLKLKANSQLCTHARKSAEPSENFPSLPLCLFPFFMSLTKTFSHAMAALRCPFLAQRERYVCHTHRGGGPLRMNPAAKPKKEEVKRPRATDASLTLLVSCTNMMCV